jgi:cell division protein FtsW (lipid II flippase)
MPAPISIFPSDENQGINFRLWLGILVPPLAGGANTLVGYMVSNYDCNVHNRHLVLLVNVLCALLCIVGGFVSYSTQQKLEQRADDGSDSLLHTRRFMMHLGLWFACGFLLFIIAGTLSTFVLHACDL